jgi:uncharacterized membrane protein YhaH (DUF805 family)
MVIVGRTIVLSLAGVFIKRWHDCNKSLAKHILFIRNRWQSLIENVGTVQRIHWQNSFYVSEIIGSMIVLRWHPKSVIIRSSVIL